VVQARGVLAAEDVQQAAGGSLVGADDPPVAQVGLLATLQQFAQFVAARQQLGAIRALAGVAGKAFAVEGNAGFAEDFRAGPAISLQLLHQWLLGPEKLLQDRQLAPFQGLEFFVDQLQELAGVADILGEQIEQGRGVRHLGLGSSFGVQ
ncbi:hypothetical protein ACX04_23300, partial [Vibrio parahaemolyticus]